MKNSNVMPVIFVPHGGGPMPLLGEPSHAELTAFLKTCVADFPQPKAILVVTAHWEESVPTVTSGTAPGMYYDYYGFPPESYEFTYSAPGNPQLAQRIVDLASKQGVVIQQNTTRDFDHGTFVPLMLMYPKAEIPVIQISLIHNLDPEAHIALGKALAPLREEGVLVVGSGMSFHNMQAFFSRNPTTPIKSERFDEWLTHVLTSSEFDNAERQNRLAAWSEAPEARFCHPREEHLLPLHVCFGAASLASRSAIKAFNGMLFNTKISAFVWQ